MSTTTRRIREMSVVVESDIPLGVTLHEYRASRATDAKRSAAPAGRLARLRRRRTAAA